MIDVTIVYDSAETIDKIKSAEINTDAFYTFINEASRKEKKKAYELKSYWGARLTPFILVTKEDKPLTAFYSEDKGDAIDNLIKFLNSTVCL